MERVDQSYLMDWKLGMSGPKVRKVQTEGQANQVSDKVIRMRIRAHRGKEENQLKKLWVGLFSCTSRKRI